MKTSESLVKGAIYTRSELRKMFGIRDATINTGTFRPKGHDSVWLFVTEKKTSDRTQYHDLLDNDILHWDGQTMGRTDHWIIEHKDQGLELLLFYRKSKTEHPGAGFRYEGPFEYVSHLGSHPTRFTLRRASNFERVVASDLEALRAEEEYTEGTKTQRLVNHYERDKNLRAAAVAHHGVTCKVCGFNFERAYGKRGKDYIEVHHLTPVSNLGIEIKVDPESDMTVLCSNCHRMVHRRRDHVLTPEELKGLLGK
jgi:5-methylcytosine-specific restriction protein A